MQCKLCNSSFPFSNTQLRFPIIEMKKACYSYNYLKLLAILSRNLRHINNNDKHKGKNLHSQGPHQSNNITK